MRVDFGPRGRRAFLPHAVGSFVYATRPPWQVFPGLKGYLCGPNDHADYRRCEELAGSLTKDGYFAQAEPRLVALMEKYRRVALNKGTVLEIPQAELPEDPNDLVPCDKLVLTEVAGSVEEVLEESS